ncbi:MAG: amidohydrolase, partial [Geodermatophilaceae bacterium]|nr:amidohydrolase [Geodermatophilaceae bacterium]
LVDAHMHPATLGSLKPAWRTWSHDFGDAADLAVMHDEDGRVVPAAFLDLLDRHGVDHAMVLCEYSPKVTGMQTFEDLAPLAAHAPGRVHPLANINPHMHFPVAEELQRQLDLGAVALKLHPVHGGFPANDRALYPAYEVCRSAGIAVVVHCGTSSFPGSMNAYADPVLLLDVLRDFPGLPIVLAHGGRGWWYEAAAFLALSQPDVWIELSGLPPSRLTHYFSSVDFARLSRKLVFGTDWPGVPSISDNARAVAALCPDTESAGLVLGGNALRLYLRQT